MFLIPQIAEMGMCEIQRRKQVEEANRELKQVVSDRTIDKSIEGIQS